MFFQAKNNMLIITGSALLFHPTQLPNLSTFDTDVTCQYIVAESNILIDQETVSFIDNTAFLSCHPLYDGDMEQWTCTDQGRWDGVAPTCQGISITFIVSIIISDTNNINWDSGIGFIRYKLLLDIQITIILN